MCTHNIYELNGWTVYLRRDGQAELTWDWEASYIDGLLATDNYLLISSN